MTLTARARWEGWEQQALSPYAAQSSLSRGRERSITPCQTRTDFQRDCDRIIHSKAFRRLMHKTQMFLAPEGDHYRTRLTHTMEVSQIARTIVRALQLNEDLVEAIALGHDLGHTPFGHSGERALDRLHPNGFRHNEQSARVVDLLEDGAGLNLTWEVREGIRCHSGEETPSTLEGAVIQFADRIAYINHDIDDAIRADLLRPEELPLESTIVLGDTHGRRIDTLVNDVIDTSFGKNAVGMSESVGGAMLRLRQFMFDNVYRYSIDQREEERAHHIVTHLYEYFCAYPSQMPRAFARGAERYGLETAVCDYIAGLTDRSAISLYQRMFIPSSQC